MARARGEVTGKKPTDTLVDEECPWGKPELAAYLGVSVSAIDKMIAKGTAPPGFRVGWLWRWWPSVVRRWTEAGGTSQESG
jgi:predicted DNA-binding transcriptional regulator AlpA